MLDVAGQTVFCTRCRKSWNFRKWRFRCFALWKNSLFRLKKWFLSKIYGFWKIFLAQNVMKIIFRTFPVTHREFNCRIKELENPTKLNLSMQLSAVRLPDPYAWNNGNFQCKTAETIKSGFSDLTFGSNLEIASVVPNLICVGGIF